MRKAVEARAEAKAAAAAAAAATASGDAMDEGDDDEDRGRDRKRKRRGSERDISRGNSTSVDPHNRGLTPSRDTSGMRPDQIAKARKLKHAGQLHFSREGRAGEADRMFKNKMPKHLFSGKTSGSKTRDRR